MKLKLNKQELEYLTIIIEQNLEKNNSFMNMNNENYMNMLHNLYSKLINIEDKIIKEDNLLQQRNVLNNIFDIHSNALLNKIKE